MFAIHGFEMAHLILKFVIRKIRKHLIEYQKYIICLVINE